MTTDKLTAVALALAAALFVGPASPAANAASYRPLITTPPLPMFGGTDSGAFRISDNESPAPTNRVFINYSYYSNTIFNLHREVVGFEKTLFDSRASIGMRLPFYQSPFASDLGDVSLIAKVAILTDPIQPNNILSGGLVVTFPTTPHADTLIQPFLGWNEQFGNLYLQGFHSIVFPTGAHAGTRLINDVAAGFWLYQGSPNQFFSALIPTVGLHIDTPLNYTGDTTTDLTLGARFGIKDSHAPGVSVSFPLAGPRSYDMAFNANFDFRW